MELEVDREVKYFSTEIEAWLFDVPVKETPPRKSVVHDLIDESILPFGFESFFERKMPERSSGFEIRRVLPNLGVGCTIPRDDA